MFTKSLPAYWYNENNVKREAAMDKKTQWLMDGLFMASTLFVSFFLNLALQEVYHSRTLIPMIFVLGVFLVSWKTQGYFWGIASSMISVLLVNYTFTYPYWAFDLISPECIFSAVVMLIVSVMTGALTTKLKVQGKIRAEIERERMRANLLRAVSHDLRTPLTSIYGSTSTILENYDALTKEQKLKLTREVQEDAQWLIRMVENLLSVTRIDDGKVQISKIPTVLEELIDAVILKFHKHYPDQTVTVRIPDDFISIPMDAMLIEQVLLNILENAVNHAVGMTELVLTVADRDSRAWFSVRDNGCGIPADRMKLLFTGYLDRADHPADGTRHNMGIGLSVCSAIVKAHGSEIYARNLPDGGVEFSFSLEKEETNEQQ